MSIIKLTPEEMLSQAQNFKFEAQNIDEMISRLTILQQEVSENWLGQSSNSFSQNFEQLKPNLITMSTNLKLHSDNLITSCNAMQQLDEQLSSQLLN